MNLKDEKRSRFLIDNTWIPYTEDDEWMHPEPKDATPRRRRRHNTKPSNHGAYPVDPTHPKFMLNPDEIEMMKSGASLQELMFIRALMTPGSGNNSLHPDLWDRTRKN